MTSFVNKSKRQMLEGCRVLRPILRHQVATHFGLFVASLRVAIAWRLLEARTATSLWFSSLLLRPFRRRKLACEQQREFDACVPIGNCETSNVRAKGRAAVGASRDRREHS